jgi:formylglycine-generating enzyme required for sulfatase activity
MTSRFGLVLVALVSCATPRPVATPGCPEGMVFTPGGTFTSLQGLHQLPAHCLDRTEFTVSAYRRCVDAGACTPPDAFARDAKWLLQSRCNWNHPEGRSDHPVNCVTWQQAVAACAFEHKRLPTDAELEWAMRNGANATTYPWGNEPPRPEHANACGAECQQDPWKRLHPVDDHFPETAPVGHFPAGDNSWGVHDLAGNVEEWTSTPYGTDDTRRHRGGSFTTNAPDYFSTTPSDASHVLTHDPAIGFRCAASPR